MCNPAMIPLPKPLHVAPFWVGTVFLSANGSRTEMNISWRFQEVLNRQINTQESSNARTMTTQSLTASRLLPPSLERKQKKVNFGFFVGDPNVFGGSKIISSFVSNEILTEMWATDHICLVKNSR